MDINFTTDRRPYRTPVVGLYCIDIEGIICDSVSVAPREDYQYGGEWHNN